MTEGRGWNSGGPRGALGVLELTLENYEAAYEVVLPAIETYRKLGVAIVGQILDAAEALAGMGRPAEGRELLEEAVENAGAMMRLPWPTAAAARARGLLAEAEGDLERAEEELERAVADRRGGRLAARARPQPPRTWQGPAASAQEAGAPAERSSRRWIFSTGSAHGPGRRAQARELGRIGGRKTAAGRPVDDRVRDRRARRRGTLEQGGRAGAPPRARRRSSGISRRSTASSACTHGRSSRPSRGLEVIPGISPVVAGAEASLPSAG